MTVHKAARREPRPLDPEAARSHTLPGFYYFAPEIYEEEKTAIFYRTWQYVGHVSMLAETGAYIVRDIAEESVVVLRHSDGAARAFHNVCQHRAHRLLEGEGRLKGAIVCPYHAWTYDLDGALKHARGLEHIVDFERSDFGLKAVRLEALCGFLFVNLDPEAAGLAEQTRGLEEEIRSFSPAPERLAFACRRDYPLAANWKNSVENYSECYHCPNRHPSLSQGALDMTSYRISVHPGYHSHRSRGKGAEQGYEIDAEAARPQDFGSWLVWPNLSLEVYPGGYLTVFHHVPAGPERTVQVAEWYFPEAEPTAEQREVIDFVHQVRSEDLPICESVQRGLHSRGYGQGRFVVDPERSHISEHAVHDFQLKVVTALGREIGV